MFRLHRSSLFTLIWLLIFAFVILNIVQNQFTLYQLPSSIKFQYKNIASKVKNTSSNSITINETQETPKQLICEKVWNNVLLSRKRHFSSEISPAHFVVNEYLNFVSVGQVCEGLSSQFGNSSQQSRLLVVLVSSTRAHFKERQIIRKTWGSLREYSDGWKIRVVFLLGQSANCFTEEGESHVSMVGSTTWNTTRDEELELEDEQNEFGDLVIGSFTDTYRNNTYRHLMGYKYVLERCPQAEFIVKTDDDVFVNIPMIINKRSREGSDMFCKVMKKRAPVRCKNCKKGKWFITKDEWPTEKYPTFCLGAFFGVTREWVKMIYGVRNLGGFFWVDDVLISGRLREIAEKEFRVKAKLRDVSKLVRYTLPKGICGKVTQRNVIGKRKKLPMFLHLNRNRIFGKYMECLSNISMWTNL